VFPGCGHVSHGKTPEHARRNTGEHVFKVHKMRMREFSKKYETPDALKARAARLARLSAPPTLSRPTVSAAVDAGFADAVDEPLVAFANDDDGFVDFADGECFLYINVF
jgi:hypothetical protein